LGVDKLVIQSAAFKNLKLISEISEFSGSQSISVTIDVVQNDDLDYLGKRMHAFGLINSYAKFLKIPKDEIEKKLNLISTSSNTKSNKHRLINLDDESKLTPSKDSFFNFLLVSILLFLILLSLYNSFESHHSLITNKDLVKELKRTTLE
jgi:cytoskeletal protein RodZ